MFILRRANMLMAWPRIMAVQNAGRQTAKPALSTLDQFARNKSSIGNTINI